MPRSCSSRGVVSVCADHKARITVKLLLNPRVGSQQLEESVVIHAGPSGSWLGRFHNCKLLHNRNRKLADINTGVI